MNESIQTVCQSCGAINRIPAERVGQKPNCGKCRQQLFPGRPIELSETSFERFITKSQIPVVVDFWADWCGPCKMMAPAYAAVAARAEPQILLAKVNTEHSPNLASRFGIRSIPTLIVFQEGRETKRQSGALSEAALWQFIQRLI